VIYENIVIGAGASALMFGANIKNKSKTLILEKNSYIGAKILVSGGGRCNFTNKFIKSSDYLGNLEFFGPILKEFNQNYIYSYFTKRGLKSVIKNNSQYFCQNSAKELLDILKNECKGVNFNLNCEVLKVDKQKDIFRVYTTKGEFRAKRVVVASGGLSYPKLGASDIGYKIAKSFNHNIITTNPALVGFTLQSKEHFFKTLSGVSLEVIVKVEDKEFKNRLLFAHKGISGPAILDASLFWNKGLITIDFLPGFKMKSLQNSKKAIATLLPMPKRATKAFLENLNIRNVAYNKLSSDEKSKLEILKSYSFAPAGTFGYTKAEVTKGGVDTTQIDSNLMSKNVKNLFFLGELLDVTGRVGGFNFQWAFATALKLAQFIKQS